MESKVYLDKPFWILILCLTIYSCNNKTYVKSKTNLSVKNLAIDNRNNGLIIIEKNQISKDKLDVFIKKIEKRDLLLKNELDHDEKIIFNNSKFLQDLNNEYIVNLSKYEKVDKVILSDFVFNIRNFEAKYYCTYKIDEKIMDNIELVICFPNKNLIYYFYFRNY